MSDGSTATPHFGFPLLPANASQPEVFVNEALIGIDTELYALSTASGGGSSEVSSDTGGGGSGGTYVVGQMGPDSPPGTALAEDDEFNGSTLDSKWTWVNQGTLSESLASGQLHLVSPFQSGPLYVLGGIVQPLPGSGTWRYRTKLNSLDVGNNAGFVIAGIMLYDATGHGALSFSKVVAGDSGQIDQWTDLNTYGSLVGAWPAYEDGIEQSLSAYLEIENDGTNYNLRYSATGYDGSFILAVQVAVSTYNRIGIYCVNSNGSNPSVGRFEWFRRMDGASAPSVATSSLLPVGGSTGQVLTKLSSANGDAGWETPSGGGSEVSSDTGTLPLQVRTATFTGGSSAVSSSTNEVPIVIADNCVIEKIVTLGIGGTGSCVLDIYHGNYAAFPPATSICASAKPTIAAAKASEDSTLTGWTTSLSAGDILLVHLDSSSTFIAVHLAIHLRITG